MNRRTILLLVAALFCLFLSFLPAAADRNATQAETPIQTSIDELAQGKTLFQVKGCATCHRHQAINGVRDRFDTGPDLTNYAGSAEFLTQWLADPMEIKPEASMPNLNLSPTQIQYLTAFLLAAD